MKNATLVLAAVLLLTAAPAAAATPEPEPSVGIQVVDLLLVRPVSIFGSVLSNAAFAVSLPFTFPAGVSHEATAYLVVAPWRFTAGRDLGNFGTYIDGRTITGRLIE